MAFIWPVRLRMSTEAEEFLRAADNNPPTPGMDGSRQNG
jgi:hypothetical protein